MSIIKYWQSYNWFSLCLWPLSLIYCLVISIRKRCYQFHCFAIKPSKVPVIIIGNITVGGNGKTPLIIQLLKEFKNKGYTPGVVSRGYGAINSDLSKGAVEVDTSQESKLYGDEPWMIAKKLDVPVVIGHKRALAVEYLIKNYACDMVFSDDGLQHYAMARDIEICVVDTSKKFGNGFCLPAGPLREPISRLKEIDFIVHHKTSDSDSTNIETQDFQMHLEFDHILPLNGIKNTKEMQLLDFKDKTVHAVAGIANPLRFFNQLRKHGINVIEHAFADHYQYRPSDFEFGDDLPILMTEKDAVKCIHFELKNCSYISVKTILSKDLVSSIIAKLESSWVGVKIHPS